MKDDKPFEVIMKIEPFVLCNGDEVVIHGGCAKELIRCKDCDMWDRERSVGKKSLGTYRFQCENWSDFEGGMMRYTSADDFCSYAERREE